MHPKQVVMQSAAAQTLKNVAVSADALYVMGQRPFWWKQEEEEESILRGIPRLETSPRQLTMAARRTVDWRRTTA